LDAYFRAFSKDDRVVLRLRTYVPKFVRVGPTNVTQIIEDYVHTKLGRSLSDLPRVVWEAGMSADRRSEAMTRMDMRALYASGVYAYA
jgi:hypothetical protein